MIAKRLLAIQIASSPPAPAATDVYYDYRSLILNMQGASGSTTFTDSSPNNFTVTPYGNAQIASDATFGTVGSFDGTNSMLSATSSILNFSSGEFTIEFWFYSNSVSGTRILFESGVGATNGLQVLIYNGTIHFGVGGGGKTVSLSCSANQWNHFAGVKSGSSLFMFLNGVKSASTAQTINSESSIYIGARSGQTFPFNGLIGPLRISPWAVYKSNFTPSQDLFPAAPDSIYANPYYDKVALQLKFDGTNGSTSFVDTGPNAFAVTPSGNAQITSASKYGSGAGAFDGNDFITIPTSTALALGSGPFTVELWLYMNTIPASGGRIILYTGNASGSYILRIEPSTGYIFSERNYTSTNEAKTNVGVSAQTWTHIAITRDSANVMRTFLNGVQYGSGTVTSSYASSGGAIAATDTGSQGIDCKIDELEITPGVAKYKANFTPPVRGLSTIYNPYTTLPVSGAALWLDGADSSTLFTDAGVTPVTTSGDLVYQWSDKSGNNRHATQATSANRPTWLPPASGQNGLGVVAFDGVNDSLSGDFGTTSIMNSVFTLHGVFQWTSNANTAPVFFYAGDRSTSKDRILWYYTGKGRYDQYASGVTGPDMTSNIWYRVSLTKNSLTNVTIEINGVSVTGNVGNQNIASTLYQLASIKSEANGYAQMKWAELIIYPSTQSSGDQTLVKDYLKAKWGTP